MPRAMCSLKCEGSLGRLLASSPAIDTGSGKGCELPNSDMYVDSSFHMRAVLSRLPVASRWPHGSAHREVMSAFVPSRTSRHVPVEASHTLTALSLLLLTKYPPPNEQSASTSSRCPRSCQKDVRMLEQRRIMRLYFRCERG